MVVHVEAEEVGKAAACHYDVREGARGWIDWEMHVV